MEDDEMTAAMMFEAGDHSYVYAHVLRQTLELLRHNEACSVTGSDGGVDLLRVDSLLNLGLILTLTLTLTLTLASCIQGVRKWLESSDIIIWFFSRSPPLHQTLYR